MASNKIAIQISDSELRLLSAQGVNLTACECRERGVDLAADIKQAFSAIKANDSTCTLIISRREFVLQMLQLPSSDPHEISRMLALQIPRIVPFDETQAIYNYRLIQTRESGYSDVTAAVILNSTIQNYIDAIYAAGLSLSDILVSFDLNAAYVRKFLLSQFKDLFCSAVIIGDVQSSEMVIFQNGQITHSYHLPYGKETEEKHGKMFSSSIQQALDDYEKTDLGEKVQTVYLDDKFTDAENIKDHLLQDESLRVDTMDLLGNLPGNAQSFIKEHNINTAWIPLIGNFFTTNRGDVKSFLPKRIYSSKAKEQKKKAIVHFMAVLSAAILLTAGLCTAVLHRHQAHLLTIEQQIEKLGPILRRYESENDFLKRALDHRLEENSIVYKIQEIYLMIPQEVSLQGFSMKAGGVFELQGVTIKGQDVNSLQSALVESSLFKNVDLQYTTKRKRFNKEYTEFKIVFESDR